MICRWNRSKAAAAPHKIWESSKVDVILPSDESYSFKAHSDSIQILDSRTCLWSFGRHHFNGADYGMGVAEES
ncbi:MAG: hypothetical protein ACJAVK_000675 [Akkermansiaceae bacterium]